MTQPNQSNKKPTRNVSRVGDVTSLYHTEGHEQELREQLLGMAVMVCHRDEPQRINGTFNFIDIEALVTAHTNAEIAKAKLEAFDVAFDCHDYDRLRAYRAELLKEVK